MGEAPLDTHAVLAWMQAHPGRLRELLSSEDPDDLDDALAMWSGLADRLVSGDSVVAHCAAGIGRAGSTAIAVLMRLGATLDVAADHVRRHRPAAGPQTHAQQLMLEEVERRLLA